MTVLASSSASTAPATTTVIPCALCEKPATSKCSRCKEISFCGEQCQRTLWPTHRTLCGGDPDVFRQAAVSTQETDILHNELPAQYHDGLPLDEPRLYMGHDVLHLLRSMSELMAWKDIEAYLRADPRKYRAEEDFDHREDTIIAARGHLRHVYAQERIQPSYTISEDWPAVPTSTPWILMAERLHRIAGCIDMFLDEAGHDAYNSCARGVRILNPYLRQLLIQCVTQYQYEFASSEAEKQAWLRLGGLAIVRAAGLLAEAPVGPNLKRAISKHLGKVWSPLGKKQLPNERRKPNVHP
ncbi:hypothetical protein JCM10908_005780 [Rhodotorula pacifica]|uniref:zinc finger MYND domain-containing protein n=1 Tax=Rhodotorula pacifica TaxID=1495444 RepID=UPI00317F7DA0